MSELIDNRAHRIRTLKEVIRHLHAGEAPDAVRGRLRDLVRECDAAEIAAMEQELIDEGVPVQEIMGMCDLHAQVVREILVERQASSIPAGHPVDTFRRENTALRDTIASLRESIHAALSDGADGKADSPALDRCRQHFNDLMDVDKHYQRKEHLLFSCLERHGITGPSKVMWGKDDEARALLKQLDDALTSNGDKEGAATSLPGAVERALAAVEEMIFKEENILLPMSLQTLTETEWGEIWAQSPQFGWCLIEPAAGYRPPAADGTQVAEPIAAEAERSGIALEIVPPAESAARPPRGSLIFPTGSLTLDQLKAIFTTLPVDITFVDADDRVRFFSEGPNRIFVRPKTVIGRKVQHCHPPSSVDVVERILDDFRSGRQDVAEFWIEFQGRFVHIRYFALRDEAATYLGTLEVTQDLTALRKLTGERRLLAYS
ncbi:MAG: DUF438 domain-containing protein [Planctomycetota bacterium]|nr:DUF438 domain-containing protein [Planctomycetota bacterium]